LDRLVGFGGICWVFDFDGAAGRGQVGTGFGDMSPGFLVEVADHLSRSADNAKAADVGRGELEAVEERVGILAVDVAAGQRIDDAGDGKLGGFAVLDSRERDASLLMDAGRVEVVLIAVDIVAAVQAVMEVTEL
jgi:hypothetical protein